MHNVELDRFVLDKLLNVMPAYSRQSTTFVMRCPICGDSKKNKYKRRGVLYTAPKLMYHCFNCNITVTGLTFLRTLSADSFKTIMSEYNRLLIDNFSVSDTTKLNTDNADIIDVSDSAQVELPEISELTDAEYEYLKQRRITELPHFDLLHLMNCKYLDNDFIFIPWLDRGRIMTYQMHNFNNVHNARKYTFQRNANKLIYGLDRIDVSFKYIVCFEGVYDSVFVQNGVAIGGTHITDAQSKELAKRYPQHQIVIAFDNDTAGCAAMKKIAMSDTSRYEYLLPELNGYKDINDYALNANLAEIGSKEFVMNNLKTGIELIAALINV